MVQFLAHNGFTVLIDNHLREDGTALEQPRKWFQVSCRWQLELASLA